MDCIKRWMALLLSLTFCLLLTGAGAPVLPSKGLYLTDYAGMLFREHRDFMLEASLRTRVEAEVDLVVLTVKDTMGLSIEEYAAQIGSGWNMGGPSGEHYIVLLYDAAGRQVWAHSGEDFADTALSMEVLPARFLEVTGPFLEQGKNSKAVFEGYKYLVRTLYEAYGITPDKSFASKLEPGQGPNDLFWTALLFVGVMLIMLRSVFVSRHYRLKYGQARDYQRRRFSRPVQDIEFDIIREDVREDDEEDEDKSEEDGD